MYSNSKYYIFPFNGNTMEILDNIDTKNCLNIIDDKNNVESYLDIKIVRRKQIKIGEKTKLIFALGSEKTIKKREYILDKFNIKDNQLITVIDPYSNIGKAVNIGKGTIIMAGTKITSNAILGKCIIVLHNSIIHHDCKIGDFTIIGSNSTIAGGVVIGNNCYIGSGALIKPGISIGSNVIIGMGSVVTKNIKSNRTVYGVPAK
jgi:sugar O-acyltransferase (sialic acid O-acetyltransferase NeuD family)